MGVKIPAAWRSVVACEVYVQSQVAKGRCFKGSNTSFSCPSSYLWSFLVSGVPPWLLGFEAIKRGFGFILVMVCGHREWVVQMMVLTLHEELLLLMLFCPVVVRLPATR
ncbi:Uncharacterized protein Rs2_13413 [Raphanus sativus]|nr:Uncharacterized protein Rs2_13413 [Raphanus sativus]